MLWTPLLVLLVFWVLGFFINVVGFVHLLLVAPVVILLVQLLVRRRLTS
jgi:hypothetical protein